MLRPSAYVCQTCRSQWSRNHSTARKGGLQGLRSKLQPKSSNALHELPKTPARTRFAPSPTGYLHLGSLRTALYNWLLARATGGQFIIRIEDTDQTRIVDDALPRLISDLKWAELDWDEGPDIGGPYGPYTQSQRLHHYTQHAEQLLESGHAYRCFCSPEDLEKHKQQTLDGGNLVNYPGTCRSIPPDQAARRASSGESHVVRFRSEGRPSFTDAVYGHYQKNEDESDFILMKTDGFPTYHFANVVDDHLMKITHVIRGVEWLISTPKHIALYDAFKWTPPTFAHAGLLCGPNGEKLSKRNRTIDIDIATYRDKGVLPSALNNWLALLGWSPSSKGAKGDIFPTMEEMTKKFCLKFTKGNAQTNPEKIPIIQRAHQSHLLCDPCTPDSRLEDIMVKPLLGNIDAVKRRRGCSITSDEASTLECLVPDLDVTPENKARVSHLLCLLRTLASDPKETAIDPAALLSSHPTLFFRPVLQSDAPFVSTFAQTAGATELAQELTSSIDALAKEGNWTPEAVQKALGGVLSTKPQELRTLGYTWLRFTLTGDAEAPAKPAKLHLAVLGPEEALLRLRRAEALLS
ncbi:mitochondrial glutamyl-tRNA synthetase [Plectosphaerella cucumerina]|uniref:Glutamate--tRNA ligase, mitochondrial n=1 Tax=Plectosphaerella cucumerina TaxID=40658 RepID=A0A8K0TCQ3_9PEZI|nr:mitochondrial glutamyl-tRNA synthetase [Plectosphaerella cucumerina]